MVGTALNRRDVMAGTGVAVLIACLFVLIGGKPLLVTFIPGMAVTWGVLVWLFVRGIALPAVTEVYPLYYGALAWQFLHFFEEFFTGFRENFPPLYGSAPYSADLFVGINMFSYFVFAVSFIAVFHRNMRFLIVPVLFFTIYGAIGNALAHVVWAVAAGTYFPGLFTALVYWILGPLLLARLIGGLRRAAVVCTIFAAILVPTLLLTASPL